MFDPAQYQLLDFGDCRRLERFGLVMLDRPCPAAESIRPAAPGLWTSADARYERLDDEQGRWTSSGDATRQWTISHGRVTFALKQTDFGHVGLFPEQAANWDWIAEQVGLAASDAASPLKILNLFAYTGGSTLAAAGAGKGDSHLLCEAPEGLFQQKVAVTFSGAPAEVTVTHVDAARNIVAWARHNAELSGLSGSPIRWIAEDALKFVSREIRRGNRYDAVILDPPSYGHGAGGQVWRLAEDLPRLLELCAELTAPRPRFVLLTCHTPGFTAERLQELLAATFGSSSPARIEAAPLELIASTGKSLPSGVFARWSE